MTNQWKESLLHKLERFRALFEPGTLFVPQFFRSFKKIICFVLFLKRLLELYNFIRIRVAVRPAIFYCLQCLFSFDKRKNFRSCWITFRIIVEIHRTITVFSFIYWERNSICSVFLIQFGTFSIKMPFSSFVILWTSLLQLLLVLLFVFPSASKRKQGKACTDFEGDRQTHMKIHDCLC